VYAQTGPAYAQTRLSTDTFMPNTAKTCVQSRQLQHNRGDAGQPSEHNGRHFDRSTKTSSAKCNRCHHRLSLGSRGSHRRHNSHCFLVSCLLTPEAVNNMLAATLGNPLRSTTKNHSRMVPLMVLPALSLRKRTIIRLPQPWPTRWATHSQLVPFILHSHAGRRKQTTVRMHCHIP
jgi:hypothetical protein